MWVPKFQRDLEKGVDSPVPTQVVSNEEFIPRPQNKKQAQVEALIGELGEENAKRVGMNRRDYMRTSMGLATAFIASNMVYGNHWEVSADEAFEPGATEEKWPKGEYFILDVQTHFTAGFALPGAANFRKMEFVQNMGFNLKDDAEAYSFTNFIKELFLDSETSMIVISGVPGKENNRDRKGNILEGRARNAGISVLPSWLMSAAKAKINELASSQRALCQGNCAPNHYWDKKNNKPDFNLLFEQMEREVKTYGIDSFKWYCHFDPGFSGGGFRLDDEKVTYPAYEKARELGMKTFSVHKGFASQSRTLGHMAHPGDIEKAAKDNPDLTFVIYHSALKHAPVEKEFNPESFDPETGDFEWHAELMKIKERNPDMNNVYPEIGSSFGTSVIVHPLMCQHLIGKNIKYYGADHVIWGTDCLWWGSPQWVIDAFKRFQISDELCEKFGYSKLTKEDKAKIFGLNAAKVYNVDVDAKRNALPKDVLSKAKIAYVGNGGQRDNAAYGWVRAEKKA